MAKNLERESILFLDGMARVTNSFGVITLCENGRVWQLKRRLGNDRFGRGSEFCRKIRERGYVDLDHWTWMNREDLARKWFPNGIPTMKLIRDAYHAACGTVPDLAMVDAYDSEYGIGA
jgi:hypothetical protein